MSNNKQSSVEWLWEIAYNRELTVEDWQQAKAMHKEEMCEFAFSWSHERADRIDIEKDYNETFNNAER